MKSMLRKTVSIAVIACLTLIMAIPAFALDPNTVRIYPEVSVEDGAVTLGGIQETIDHPGGDAGVEVTVMVVPCEHSSEPAEDVDAGCFYCEECLTSMDGLEGKIKYINQTTTMEAGEFLFDPFTPGPGKYTAFFGAQGVNTPYKATFTVEGSVARTIKYGDVDGSTELGASDLVALAQYMAGLTTLENDQILAADLDGSTVIGTSDLVTLAQVMASLKDASELPNGGTVASNAVVYDKLGEGQQIIAQY